MVPPTPDAARQVFGDSLAIAEKYVAELADTGVSHGLIGPREAPRLWERHVLNCAVIAELIPQGATCIDVGSGAGLPGLALAIARPDLQVTLVEPLSRRASWLEGVVERLGVVGVKIRNARAESLAGELHADVVTARAVADLPTLAQWCFPLIDGDGRLLALKGSQAQAELDAAADRLRALGASAWRVVACGEGLLEQPTQVVEVRVDAAAIPLAASTSPRGGRGGPKRQPRPGRKGPRRGASRRS
ncbi:MAG: 16S rRNA (guanine(527)-N(7))-methyltransferase RsmG [Actinomycetales bacterium]|nr:16S rRNA (guanine(527)-N(7))-methyltransferase RsmG [Actinomycetales bacterium]